MKSQLCYGLNAISDKFINYLPWVIKMKLKKLINKIKVGNGQDLVCWLSLISFLELLVGDYGFDEATKDLIRNHEILPTNYLIIRHYYSEIVDSLKNELANYAKTLSKENVKEISSDVVDLIVKRKTVFQCRDAHTTGGYYDDAEPYMDMDWNKLIYPVIKSYDFSRVLELAPGHGRNSAKLSELAGEIYLVDVNLTCIEACKKRFGQESNGCRFFYYVNDGSSLSDIASDSITFVYSWDSMVHFDKAVVRDYLVEFKRVLVPGGAGFVHHSNYGSFKPNSDWAKNPGNRSDMTADLFRKFCEEIGLKLVYQKLHGLAEGRGIEALDCVSVLQKP